MARNKSQKSNIVFSTDPSFAMENDHGELATTLEPKDQPLRIRLETKHRGGKAVTLVTGFTGAAGDAESLGKKLKAYCGTGGTIKDGEILIQGDNREKIMGWFVKNGYSKAKKAGG